jgi:hypothetical protein
VSRCAHRNAAYIDQRFACWWCPDCGAIKTSSAVTSGNGTWRQPSHTRQHEADRFFKAEAALYKHCGIVRMGHIYPIVDERESYWHVDEKYNLSYHAPKRETIVTYLANSVADHPVPAGDAFFSAEIYAGRELASGVFRGRRFTMVLEESFDDNVGYILYRNDREVTS